MSDPTPSNPNPDLDRADPARLARLMGLDAEGSADDPAGDLARLYLRLPSQARGGVVLGDFLLGAPVGSGGFGTVHAGHQLSTGRKVAVKILRDGASPDIAARFQREAAYLARFKHPHICGVLGYGKEPFAPAHPNAMEGAPWLAEFLRSAPEKTFFAMEWVEGRTLEAVFREGKADDKRRPDARTLVRWFAEAAGALAAVHAAGLIHRDVKPGNLMVAADGAVKLLDFGIARPQDPARSLATAAGSLFGTLAYMPPEQLRAAGAQELVGTAADIYALCATFYELFTGRRLLDHDALSAQDLCTRKLSGRRPEPPRALAPELPWEIETLLLCGLEPDPADRPRTMSDLERDLRRILADEPILIRRPSLSRRAQLGYRRHRRAVQAGAVAAALGAALFVHWWRTPGTLVLSVEPAGARIVVGGKELVATGAPQEIELPAGMHAFLVAAPGYATETRDIAIARGSRRELPLVLRHDQGVLHAQCAAAGAEIALDGVPHGSRIVGLAVDTGPHTLRAYADDHFDAVRKAPVGKGETLRLQLPLDRGVLWRQVAPELQSGFVVSEDGRSILHNATDRIIAFDAADGHAQWSMDAPLNTRRTFMPLELGGDVGRVAVSGLDLPGSGAQVAFLAAASDRHLFFAWQGPALAGGGDPQSVSALAVGDLDGDGVAEVAVACRSGVHLLDVAVQKEVRRGALAEAPLEQQHLLAVAGTGNDATVLMTGLGADGHTWAGAWRLADGKTLWRSDLGPVDGVVAEDVDGDGQPELLAWHGEDWRILGADGTERHQGRFPFRLAGSPFLVPSKDGRCDWLLVPADPAQPVVAQAFDGAVRWRGPAGAKAGQPTRQGLRLMQVPGGEALLATRDALLFVDPANGHVAHRLAGEVDSLQLAAGDDGVPEVLAMVRGTGLVCADGAAEVRWTLRLADDLRLDAVLPGTGGASRRFLMHKHAAQLCVARGAQALWSARAAAPLQAAPRVVRVDGRTLVAQLGPFSGDSGLRCFEGADGAVRWSAPDRVAPNCPPTAATLDGAPALVAVGRRPDSTVDEVLAWRCSDGARIRHLPLPEAASWMSCTPAVGDLNGDGEPDFVVSRWDAKDFVALDGKSGAVLWRCEAAGPCMGGLALADLGAGHSAVIAPSRDGLLRALDGKSGELLWSFPLGAGGHDRMPVLATLDGIPTVLTFTATGDLLALDLRSPLPAGAPREIWRSHAAGASRAYGHPVVTQVGGRTLVVAPLGNAGVVAFDWVTKREAWRTPAGLAVIASPAVVADREASQVFVVATDGSALRLDVLTGRILWRAQVGQQRVEADPAVADLDGDGKPDLLVADYAFRLTAVDGRRMGK